MPALRNNISFQEKLLFTKHLDTMTRAAIPISESLDTIASQTKSEKFKAVIAKVLSDIENGKSLSEALQKHPDVFNDFYISLISVGEESGTLDESLKFLADQMAKDYNMRKKIQGALFYPGLVLSATFILGGFISFFILPKLVDFFESFEIELPLTTKILLFFANAVKNYGILMIVVFIGTIISLVLLSKTQRVKKILHRVVLKIPIFGVIMQYSQLARFARNLGTLIRTGVPVARALEITANTLGNSKYKEDLLEIANSLTKGKNIGDTMDDPNYWEYPPNVSKMISVGEKSGKLDEVLLYLGDFYEEEIDNISKNLTTIIEPLLLIAIAIVVGFVALAIISPIYELTGSVNR